MNTYFQEWTHLSSWLSTCVMLGLIHIFLIPTAAFISFVDRKLGADLQARVGPNRTPLNGLFQPLADLLKLLQKDSVSPAHPSQKIWMLVMIFCLYASVAVLPLGPKLLILDTQLSPFILLLSLWSVSISGLFLGLTDSSLEQKLNAFRSTSQTVAGSFPVLVALITAGTAAGGFDWNTLVDNALYWNPFHYLAFFSFFIGGLIAFNLPPFDSSHSFLGRSGFWLSIFRLNQFYALFLWSVVSVVSFLGGWSLPFVLVEWLQFSGFEVWLVFLQLFIVILKAFLLSVLVIWVSRVNPRVRVDHLTEFSWKVLSPLSLIALLGTIIVQAWFYRGSA